MTGDPAYNIDVQVKPTPGKPHVAARVSFSHGMMRIHGAMIRQSPAGRLKVHFPDKARLALCPECGTHVAVMHRFCFGCGAALLVVRPAPDHKGRVMRFSEVAHPIDPDARGLFSRLILEAYLARIGVRPRLFVPGAVG